MDFALSDFDTEYDQAKVPPYNGNDPPTAPGSLKALLFPPLLNNVGNKGTQGVRARYSAEVPPFISIVRYPGRPAILGMEDFQERQTFSRKERHFQGIACEICNFSENNYLRMIFRK